MKFIINGQYKYNLTKLKLVKELPFCNNIRQKVKLNDIHIYLNLYSPISVIDLNFTHL